MMIKYRHNSSKIKWAEPSAVSDLLSCSHKRDVFIILLWTDGSINIYSAVSVSEANTSLCDVIAVAAVWMSHGVVKCLHVNSGHTDRIIIILISFEMSLFTMLTCMLGLL